jgi:hypothetical protein
MGLKSLLSLWGCFQGRETTPLCGGGNAGGLASVLSILPPSLMLREGFTKGFFKGHWSVWLRTPSFPQMAHQVAKGATLEFLSSSRTTSFPRNRKAPQSQGGPACMEPSLHN